MPKLRCTKKVRYIEPIHNELEEYVGDAIISLKAQEAIRRQLQLAESKNYTYKRDKYALIDFMTNHYGSIYYDYIFDVAESKYTR